MKRKDRILKKALAVTLAGLTALTPLPALAAPGVFNGSQRETQLQGMQDQQAQMPGMQNRQYAQQNRQNMPRNDQQQQNQQLQGRQWQEYQQLQQDQQFRGNRQLQQNKQMPGMQDRQEQQTNGQSGQQVDPGTRQSSQNVTYADSPTEIVTGSTSNSAASLSVSESDAEKITMSADNNEVKIDSAGTYLITGSCSDGSVTVKKNTTGVVLILEDLTLASSTGAPLSLNKYSEVKLVINGNVSLTDNENPEDETSTDTDTADAYDGACIKAKDGSIVYVTGNGTLTLKGNAKNGIKAGGDDTPSFIMAMGGTVNITAANDAINSGYDMVLLSGTYQISAGDDALHADRILTIGQDGSGPDITIAKSLEGMEGTVVNLFGGNVSLTSSDDGINAANSEDTYSGEMEYSINMTGGEYTVNSSGDGLDSNGNINLTGGHITIKSASNGGEAGIDYDGSLYMADGTVTNSSGVSGPDNMGGGGNMGGGMLRNGFR